MAASAVCLGILGLVLSFLPDETIAFLEIPTHPVSTLFLQLLGSLYLGFGMLNWMAKGVAIGGIYNKPIAIGNFMHFGVGAIALLKLVFVLPNYSQMIIPLTLFYTVFTICFAYVFMNNPKQLEN